MSIVGIILLSIGTIGILSVYTYSKRHGNYVKYEQEKELYEKYNIGDTVLFYYETVELLTKKYQ